MSITKCHKNATTVSARVKADTHKRDQKIALPLTPRTKCITLYVKDSRNLCVRGPYCLSGQAGAGIKCRLLAIPNMQ